MPRKADARPACAAACNHNAACPPCPACLQDILSRWDELPRAMQQTVFEEALLSADEGDLEGLEAGLQLALSG